MSYDARDLSRAVRIIAGFCDGAMERDGEGFNKSDSRYGTIAALIPHNKWTDVIAYNAWTMLAKYQKQLASAGISYDEIQPPPRPTLFSGDDAFDVINSIREGNKNKVFTNGDVFIVQCEYEEQLVEAISKIHGASWNQSVGVWVIPLEVAMGSLNWYPITDSLHQKNLIT